MSRHVMSPDLQTHVVAGPPQPEPAEGCAHREREEPGEVDAQQLLVALLGSRGLRSSSMRAELPDWRLARLWRADAHELARELDLTPGAGRRLAVAFELARRVARARRPPRPALRTPAAVQRELAPELVGLERERFWALLLNGKHRLLARELVSEGTLTSSLVHPREFFRRALRGGAAAVIAAHNHPSGDPEPSAEDQEVTRRLSRAAELLGVPLLDHVIVVPGGWVSLRERMPW